MDAKKTLGTGVLALGLLSSCRQDMHDQPRYEPLERSTFFADGQASRPLVEGTVSRSQPYSDRLLETGKIGNQLADRFPFPITRSLMERGRERYNIFCSPCHDRAGTGHGIIVRRGFRRPPSFHSDRLRQMPVGHFFDVITHGYATMYSYASRVPRRDRWAIAAYIRALQLSQHAPLEALSPEERKKLGEETP